jgi:sugar phosphate isomerase/epimerase
MSNNFNQDDPAKFKAQVDLVKAWLGVAAQVKAPASRIFGGHIPRKQQGDASAAAAGKQRILDGLGQVEKEARRLGVVLALENHGGLPCSAEEQVAVIRQINSPFLRATIDVGNYMQCGQEGHVGTAIAAPYCAYTHFKDFRKLPDATIPRGYKLEACVIGEGEVDLRACVAALRKADYDGVVAIEYEGAEDETTAVPRSVANMKKAAA